MDDPRTGHPAPPQPFESIQDITAEEWDVTFHTNVHAMFYLSKAALPHMKPGSSIINTSSINAKNPTPMLLAYATTKGAIANFTAGLAQLVAKDGVRVNAVAPGPINHAGRGRREFRRQHADRPRGAARRTRRSLRVLASQDASYITSALIPVTGGRPML